MKHVPQLLFILCPPDFIFLPSFSPWPVPNHLVFLFLAFSLSDSPPCHLKQTQHVLRAGSWKGNCTTHQNTNHQLFFPPPSPLTINPISSLVVVCLSASPSNTHSLLVLTGLHHSPLCLFLPNSPSLSLFSPPTQHTPATTHCITPSFLLSSLAPSLPACLPSSFHLSSLKADST